MTNTQTLYNMALQAISQMTLADLENSLEKAEHDTQDSYLMGEANLSEDEEIEITVQNIGKQYYHGDYCKHINLHNGYFCDYTNCEEGSKVA